MQRTHINPGRDNSLPDAFCVAVFTKWALKFQGDSWCGPGFTTRSIQISATPGEEKIERQGFNDAEAMAEPFFFPSGMTV